LASRWLLNFFPLFLLTGIKCALLLKYQKRHLGGAGRVYRPPRIYDFNFFFSVNRTFETTLQLKKIRYVLYIRY